MTEKLFRKLSKIAQNPLCFLAILPAIAMPVSLPILDSAGPANGADCQSIYVGESRPAGESAAPFGGIIAEAEKRAAEAAIKPDKVVKAVITAYTSTPDQTDDSPFIAATGKRVYDGMIAANWLPFGTKIKIPSLYGDKIFTVDDRMNARYGYGRMDIWLDASKADAREFGVKRVEVEIYYQDKEIQLARAM